MEFYRVVAVIQYSPLHEPKEFEVYCGNDKRAADEHFALHAGYTRRYYTGHVEWSLSHEHKMPVVL